MVTVDAGPDFLHRSAVLHQTHVALSRVLSVVCGYDGDVEDVGSCDGGCKDAGVGVVGATAVGDDVVEVHHVTGVVVLDAGGPSHEADELLFCQQE